MTSAVQSVKEARDERSARLQEICAQEESSLQFSEVLRLLYDCTTEVVNSDSQDAHKKLISQAHKACAFALSRFRWNKAPKSIATVALNFLTILFQFLLPFGIPVRLSSISQFFDNMM